MRPVTINRYDFVTSYETITMPGLVDIRLRLPSRIGSPEDIARTLQVVTAQVLRQVRVGK